MSQTVSVTALSGVYGVYNSTFEHLLQSQRFNKQSFIISQNCQKHSSQGDDLINLKHFPLIYNFVKKSDYKRANILDEMKCCDQNNEIFQLYY